MKARLSAAVDFLSWKWSWAKEKPWYWASLLLAVGTWAVLFGWPGPMLKEGPSDARLRLWALCLQLLGAGLVWFDLARTARNFGDAGVLSDGWAWLRRGISLRRPAKEITLSALSGNIQIAGIAAAGLLVGAQPTLEERVASLETKTQATERAQARLEDEILKVEGAARAAVLLRFEALRGQQVDSERRLQSRAVSSYPHLAFGAAWAGVGTVLAAMSQEIVRLVAGQWPIPL